jgi:hypothetical protein
LNLVPIWLYQFDQVLAIYFYCSTLWRYEKKNQKLRPPSLSIQVMEGQRPLVSLPVNNWGLILTSQYAFLSCLSSFMVWYSSVLGIEEPQQSIPNLVVKLYCGEDTVGEVLQKNSSTSGW